MASSAQQEKSCIRERHRQKLHQHQHRQHQGRRILGVAKDHQYDRQSVGKLARQRKEKPSSCNGLLRSAFDFANRPSQLKHFDFIVILLQLSVLLALGKDANAEGNVGCHFVRTLCLEDSEVCFDDNIFGKCIPTTGVDAEEIENTPLAEHESRLLATMLEELQGAGLEWDHPYVQCRIQAALFSLQRQTQLPPNLCANLAPTTPEVELTDEMTHARLVPPSRFYRYQQLFNPPPKKEEVPEMGDTRFNTMVRQLQLQNRRHLRHDPMELEHFGKMDHQDTSQLEVPSVINAFLETERQRMEREQQTRDVETEPERKNTQPSQLELYQILAASEPDPQPYQRNQPNPMEQLEELVEQQRETPAPVYVQPEEVNESSELYFPDNYAPLKRADVKQQTEQIQQPYKLNRSFFRELAAEQRVEPEMLNQLSPKLKRRRLDYRGNGVDMLDEQQQQRLQESLMHNSLTPFEEEAMLASNTYPALKHRKNDRVYAEGGLIYVPENEDMQSDQAGVIKQSLLANMLGFARHERLDVKKPGPLLGPPAALKSNLPEVTESASKEDGNKEILPAHIKDSNEAHKKKKLIKNHSDEDHAPHTVDTEYAHVIVKNPIDSWSDGMRIMNELANVLYMQGYFTYLTVQPHEVSFRVDEKNPDHKTAADVARAINENRGVKNNILRRLGVTVLHAGVGDKVKAGEDGDVSASRIDLAEQGPDVTHIMAYMFAGAGAAAIIVIFITLILIKRHDKTRDKLGGLQTGGIASIAESCSKDYQDLCRARMAGKGNAAEPASSGRITTLSKENDKPPSSRSSTSSWSEEPALTNMDISTGHMVLSYMEDHLRNKGRLQREWDALCRYEAEPSAREAATQPPCANLNRTGAPLPYDHSRVVLNHLANADGLDYVNASTITDHDPRAPVCYVAAQGPLPSTLAHFWQMIWEQGAVVIVALCRLQENGEVACARYWPEEGAEVYHIYEVHLVSEHIWCDDYLVRSFYLKNLRTSETRTVTQFHFLSWPQGGVPAQAKALLDFRRKVNKSYRGRSCPIVVHGSEGAGRTGAYILLDLVLGRMNKGAREIDIAATLEHLRDQRAGLVATRQQFEFVLMAVAEEVHAILKALPANQSAEKREPSEEKPAVGQKEATVKEATVKESTVKEEVSDETPNTSKASGKATEVSGKEKEKDKDKEKPKSSSAVEKEAPKTTPSKSAKKK